MDIKELKLSPKRKEIVTSLEMKTTEDILSYYPFKYEEYNLTHYDDFVEGNIVCFEGTLLTYPSTFRYGKRSTTRFKILYEDEEISVTIFNRPWMKVDINQNMTIIGKYDGNNKVTASNYYLKGINEVAGIVPIYSQKELFNQNEIKKIISIAYEASKDELVDNIPSKYLNDHKLISYKEAITSIHFPSNSLDLKKALARLKYEEFLRFYLSLEIIKGNTKEIKNKKEFDNDKVNSFINSFEFELTKDQRKCVEDILSDLNSNKIMYRLVQGEVGSGKTAIAMIAFYANYLAGYKGAFMAPTEILAKQHYLSFKEVFEPLGIKVDLLYSSSSNQKDVKERLRKGDIDILIGTHALFSEDVEFNNLGLVITDEQHRFGVRQRRKLKDKGNNVDFILMSATPIPRTLASSLYGDMDISTIETMPLGRKGCKTYLIKENSARSILSSIKDKLKEGRQVYVIAAAIEKSNNYNAKDASNLYTSLSEELKPYKLGLLHGRLTTEEKDEIMNDFNSNRIQVLVSTTVVEVGVNVKNATMMIIYDADKFGLSQLHQLRGRIQRSSEEGTCYLLTGSKDNYALERLNVLVNTNDGFKISYEDLRLRGPGDILGTRQSGLPAFLLGDLIEDTKIIEGAKKDAKEIINNLSDEDNKKYFELISSKYVNNYVD